MNPIKKLDINKLSEKFKDYPLYSQEDKDKKKLKVILELFIPNTTTYWLLTEGNIEDNDFIFFGYCNIQYGELGYVSFNELSSLDYDINFNYYKNGISLDKLKDKYKSLEVATDE